MKNEATMTLSHIYAETATSLRATIAYMKANGASKSQLAYYRKELEANISLLKAQRA